MRKKPAKPLDFPAPGCKLCFGNRFRPAASGFQAHFIGYFSRKTHVNPPSFPFFALNRNKPAKTFVSSCLAGRFSIVFRAGSWRDLHVLRMGNRPAFLCSDIRDLNLISASAIQIRRDPVRSLFPPKLPPQGRHVPVRLSRHTSHSLPRR